MNYYSEGEFFETLHQDIQATQSGDIIAFATMSVEPQEAVIAKVLEGVGHAAMRGVEVSFAVDAYTIMCAANIGPLVLYGGQRARETRERRVDVVRTFTEALGVKAAIINEPKHGISNLYTNRSHMKASVIKDRVYLGGPSLHGAHRLDGVVGFTSEHTASFLNNLIQVAIQKGNMREALGEKDVVFPVYDNTDLLLDAGVKGQSVVLERAINLVDDAREHVVFGSQYFPNGAMLAALNRAHARGVEVAILRNHFSKHESYNTIHRAISLFQRCRNPESFFANQVPSHLPKFHAKVLLSERGAMIGSHNYIETGVKFGTGEASLYTEDAEFIEEAYKKVSMRIGGIAQRYK